MHLFEKRERFNSRGMIISILLFAAVALVFVSMLGQVETQGGDQQTKLLEDALFRAAVTCYAVEGRYPPTRDYIVEKYGVIIDEAKYIVTYDVFAPNVMPGIQVLIRGDSVDEEI